MKNTIIIILGILFSAVYAQSHALKDTISHELCLSSDHYVINEKDSNVVVLVERKSETSGELSFNYQLIEGTAIAGDDYSPVSGKLTFSSDEIIKKIAIPLIDNDLPELFEYFTFVLTSTGAGITLTSPSQAIITILDDEQTFQFQSPYFPKTIVNDLWQCPDGTLWAACSKGLVLVYYQNSQMGEQNIPTHTSLDLNAIWGTSANNVYVAGNNGLILHFDGTSFKPVPTPTDRDLFALWGTESGFMVAGGLGHTIIQRSTETAEWKLIKQGRLADPNIYRIWGNSEYFIFAVGGIPQPSEDSYGIIDHCYMHHLYENRWETMHKQPGVCYKDVWGNSNTNVYVCGGTSDNKGTMASFNGYQWNTQTTPTAPIQRIWGNNNRTIIGLLDSTDNTVVSIGQFKDMQWTPYPSGPTEKLSAICGTSIFDISIAGESGNIYQSNGLSWRQLNDPLKENLNAVWGTDRFVFAVGNNGAIFYTEGFYWSIAEGIPDVQLNDVFGFSNNHVYAVGNGGTILFYNGYIWQQVTSPVSNDLNAIWGNQTNRLFAVGSDGTIITYDGIEWSQMLSPTPFSLYDLSASGQDIVAVGEGGVILQLDGNEWSIIRTGSSDQQKLLAVWGDPDSSTLYTVGESGVAFEYQEPSWKKIRAANELYPQLNDVVGFSDHAIACDSEGNLLIYTVPIWSKIRLHTSSALTAFWKESDTSLIIAGKDGSILKYAKPLQLQSPQEISEGEKKEASVRIFPEKTLLTDLDIYLQAVPIHEAFLNSPVTIAANAQSVSFFVQIPADNTSDGAKWTGLYAMAKGYHRDVHYIQVMDTNDGHLSLQVPSEINESTPLTECTITLQKPAVETMDIWIINLQPEQLQSPETVQLPIGYTTVNFYISPVDDEWLDGSKPVIIGAMVPGWAEHITKTIWIIDNEQKILSIDGSHEERECTPNPLIESWITLSGISETPFTITITNTNPTEISVPTAITALAGQKIIPLPMTILDDLTRDGSQTIQITLTASGWQSASYTMIIHDNEPGTVEFAFDSFYTSESQDYGQIELIRNDSDSGDITVVFSTVEGTALAIEDFIPVTQTIHFESGISHKTIAIPIVKDHRTESLECLNIDLLAPSAENDHIGTISMAQLCISDDEWQAQWQNPLPQGNSLSDISAISDNEFIAVGDYGLIMHNTDSNWVIQNQLTDDNLKGIFALDATHVYAVGDNGSYLFYNGIKWDRQPRFVSFQLNAIWGADTDHLFAVGEQLNIFTNQGKLWHPIHEELISDSAFYDIWGASKDAVFFVGGSSSMGIIYFWDGISVNPMIVPKCPVIHCVWGTAIHNVYAAGDEHVILHYDGSEWQIIHQSNNTSDQTSIKSLWGIDDNLIFAVGGDTNGGNILYQNGNSWEYYGQTFPQWLTGISGWNQHIIAVGVLGTAYQLTIPETSWVSIVNDQTSDLTAIWGRNTDDIYAVGEYNQIKHYADGNWKSLTLTGWNSFHGIYGNDTTVFAVGDDGCIVSFENNEIKYPVTGTTAALKDIWGIDNTFFAVGEQGVILSFHGSEWEQQFHPLMGQDFTFNSIWGSAQDRVFVVGEYNHIEHYDGNQWKLFNGPLDNDNKTIFSIWGEGPDNFFITCEGGFLFQYSETNWIEIKQFPDNQYDIFGWDSNLVTVGAGGIHVFYESEWNELEKITANTLYGVWADNDQLFVVGYGGTQILYTAQEIKENLPPEMTPVADQTFGVDSPMEITLNVFDPDGDPLTVSVTSNNETMINNQNITINGGKNEMVIPSGSNEEIPLTITFTPSSHETGTSIITINLSDSKGLTTFQTFLLQMTTEYTVTVAIICEGSDTSINGCGNIYVDDYVCSSECSYRFLEGKEVLLTAYAIPGYHFISWAKDVSGNDRELTIKLAENVVAYALFKENDRPYAVKPMNGEIIPDSTVMLMGGFGDEDNVHYRTYWKIRVVDQPYTCTEIDFLPTSDVCHVSNSTPLTAHALTNLITGYQYAWKFGYKNALITDNTLSGTIWSDEHFFIVGKQENDSPLTIKKGDSALDYRMISLVQWFYSPLAGRVFGANLREGYDPSIIRIGTYNPYSGAYEEYSPEMNIFPGQSFWILSRVDIPMSFTGVPVTTRDPVEIKLGYGKDGWNMIACPNKASYAWNNVQIILYDEDNHSIDMNGTPLPKEKTYTISDIIDVADRTSDSQWIDPILWYWESGNYRQVKYLDAYKGYWLKVYQSNLSLRFIPEAQISSDHTRTKSIQKISFETPPLPMNDFEMDSDGMGNGCFIMLISEPVNHKTYISHPFSKGPR